MSSLNWNPAALPAATPTARRSRWALIVLFYAFLVVPALVQVLGVDKTVTNDNRALATWPSLPVDTRTLREFPQKVGVYVTDHFGLRGGLVTLNSLVRYKLGASSVKNVVIGTNGWLFYAYEYERLLEQHTGADVYAPGEAAKWVRTMEAIQDWMHKRNIGFYITVAPDKPTIYPEYLPAYPTGPTTRLQQLRDEIRTSNSKLEFVDPVPLLLKEKEHAQIYSKRDSHWTQRGAFAVYAGLMERIKARYPDIPPESIQDRDPVQAYDPSDLSWHLNLTGLHPYSPPFPYVPPPLPAQRSLIGEEMIEQLARRTPSHIIKSEIVQPKPGAEWGWFVNYYETDLKDRPRLLVFADSFTDYVMGPTALYQTFRDPAYTHNNGGRFNFKLIDELKPDIVIVVMAERYLRGMPTMPPRDP